MSLYLRPTDLTEALAHLARQPMTVAAGCTDLFPATDRQDLAGPVLDITAVDGLRGITRAENGWRIGATTTWADVLAADLPPAFDMLKQAAREVGSVQIQSAGTLAGNLCNASPAADGVPPLMALGAEVELLSQRGSRRLPLGDFLTGPRRTCLAPGELLVALHLPDVQGHSRFLKLGARRYLVISIAMVAVRLDLDAGARVRDVALAVGACSAVAARLPDLEARLIGHPARGLAARIAEADLAAVLAPIDDIRADAGYRLAAAHELLRRAVADLTQGDAP